MSTLATLARDFDPLVTDMRRDPYPVYRMLRDSQPVHRSASGFYSVSRYEDVQQVLRDHETFSSRAMFTVLMNNGREGMPPLSWNVLRFLAAFPLRTGLNPFAVGKASNLIAEDPPRHRELRSLVNRAFAPRRIEAWEPRIRELVRELLAPLERGEPFDLVHDFAIPLPVTIIAEMLGVEPERLRDFKRWSDAIIDGATGPGRATPMAKPFADATLELMSYLRSILRKRRASPEDDLISLVLSEGPGGERLNDIDAVLFVQLLLVAGNETTTNLIGNAVQALLDHPAELARVQRDPSLVPALVEEALRFDSPVQTVYRTATRDTEVAGVAIPEGSVVAALIGSANRDERRFEAADRFDVMRDTRGHIAFGFGEHFCLGASLARLEGRTALEALVPALDGLVRADRDREWIDSFLVRGPKRLLLQAAA